VKVARFADSVAAVPAVTMGIHFEANEFSYN